MGSGLIFFELFRKNLLPQRKPRANVTAFWGEQKAAEAIASAAFNFTGLS